MSIARGAEQSAPEKLIRPGREARSCRASRAPLRIRSTPKMRLMPDDTMNRSRSLAPRGSGQRPVETVRRDPSAEAATSPDFWIPRRSACTPSRNRDDVPRDQEVVLRRLCRHAEEHRSVTVIARRISILPTGCPGHPLHRVDELLPVDLPAFSNDLAMNPVM